MPLKKKKIKPTAKKAVKKAVKGAKPKVVRRARKKIPPVIHPKGEQQIEASKYYEAPPVIQHFESRGFELPQGYNDNRIVLMVRDPYWIYTYWEISGEKAIEAGSKIGRAHV